MPTRYDTPTLPLSAGVQVDRWWELFGDQQLFDLVERAMSNGLDARLVLARLDEARAVRGQALTGFRPQGSLRSTASLANSENLDGPESRAMRAVAISLPVSWELDLFGRHVATSQGADADFAAARFNYEAARASLAAQVAQTLLEARGLAVQIKDTQESFRIQRELLGILSRQVEHGLTARWQADRVASDVARVESQVLALQAELSAAKRSLLILTGDGLASATEIEISANMREAPIVPATVPSGLLVRRPDIREARAQIARAAGNVRLAELDFYPRLTFEPSLGLSVQRGPVEAMSGLWSLGIGVTVPVLDRPRLVSALAIQSARGEQAVIAYERVVQKAFAETDQALTRLNADRQRAVVLVEGEMLARRAHDSARVRFTRGLGGLQELLDAEVAWRTTRTALVSAQLDSLLRSVQAFKALGGGWTATPNSFSIPPGY